MGYCSTLDSAPLQAPPADPPAGPHHRSCSIMEDDPSCEPAAVAAAEPPTTVEAVASAIDRMRQTIREQVDVLTLKQAGPLLIRRVRVLQF